MKPYEETFRSPFGQERKEDAERILNRIREAHTAENGWVELEAGVDQHADGKWYAWRHHKHYEN